MTPTVLLLAALAFAQTTTQTTTQPTIPPIGQRTVSAEQMLREMGMAPDAGEVDAAITAAAAFPLGSMENPVRVGGPEGERAYIARLRCSDGRAPQIGQRTNRGVGAFGTIVDAYPLDCGAAAPSQTTLILDMYHSEHKENAAPPGFTITPLQGG